VRYRMGVNFLGLYGAGSPLPIWYTEELVQADPDGHAVKAFLDLFQHRLVSLFRRCGTKYRYYREYRPDGSDPISQWLFALLGVLHPSLRQGTSLDWQRLLAYAGILAMRRHSAPMIRGVLAHYFPGAPVEIDQFVAELAPIDPEQWASLGAANCRLGEDLTIGESVPDCAGRIRVRVGPLPFARFERFLPGGPDWTAAHDLVALLLTDDLRCDFELVLRAEEIPPLRIDADCPCRLGWSTWLGECDMDGRVQFPD
jgi:type VI secretion system protein ImpH